MDGIKLLRFGGGLDEQAKQTYDYCEESYTFYKGGNNNHIRTDIAR